MRATILVVGVAVVDIVMNVDEMPSRAEKYRANGASIVGGGCGGNAAVAISRLGGSCHLAARLGQDAIGEMIISGLEAEGVICKMVRRFENSRSSFSSIFIDKTGERQIVNYRDHDLPSEANWLTELALVCDAVLADTRWPEGALAAMNIARAQNIPGILDAEAPLAGTQGSLEAASHVVFSAQGLREFTGVEDLPSALKVANQRLNNFVGVTDGPNGVWWHENEQINHQAGFSVEAIDTLGAGDVWHGAFALALAEKMPMDRAIEFSNAAASLKCTKSGGRDGTPSREQTDLFVRNNK